MSESIGEMGLRLIPPLGARFARESKPVISLAQENGGSRYVKISRAALAAMGKPKYVQVLASSRFIGIRSCRESDIAARRVPKSGHVLATELLSNLGVQKGERFYMPARMVDGHMVIDMPPELIERARNAKS